MFLENLARLWYYSGMTQRYWVYDPQSGGVKIPPDVQKQTYERIMVHAHKIRPKQAENVRIRFKSQFCYINCLAEVNGRMEPMQRCRLRYFGKPDEWSMAFFTYSNEKYEPCIFASGKWLGTPEEAFEIGAVYLTEE